MIGNLGGLLQIAPAMSLINDVFRSFVQDWKVTHPPTSEAKPEKYGIFSRNDEAKVAKLILGMKDADESENVVGFFTRMFNPQLKKGAPISFQHFIESVMYRNEFFSHLAMLAEQSEPKKKGVKRVVTTARVDGKNFTTTVEEDITGDSPGPSAAAKFLETLAKRIKEEIVLVKAGAPTMTEETLRKRAFERVYKKYYKGDFTSRIRMVGEDDTRIWERFGLTKENWEQFTLYAHPLLERASNAPEFAKAGIIRLGQSSSVRRARHQGRMERARSSVFRWPTIPFVFLFNLFS